MNPLSETTARLLMRCYDEVGDRSVALAVYTRLVDRLRHELKIAPSEETWKLAEAIRTRRRNLSRQRLVAACKGHGRNGPLVGRDDEIRSVELAWGAACSGVGGVVIVHGEAGIGKSRLVTELSALACQDGALVAVGTTANIGRALYGPWAELGGALLRGLGGVPHDEPFATALAPLLPTLVQTAAQGPSDFEEARLIEGLLDLLEYAARRKPLLLVLEDMHACDDASAIVFVRAARRVHDLRVLLVETRRDHPFPPALADAENTARHSGALLAQVGLKRPGDAAIAEIVRNAGVADGDAVTRVVASADGNALLAGEAARALVRGDPSLAEGLRSTVRAARVHLATRSRALCELIAVAGRPLSVNDIRRRAQTGSDADFDAAFEGAYDAGLLMIVDGVVDFRHTLLRDAYYADLPELLRTRLHAAAARDIEENGEPELAGEAARHLLAAGDKEAAAGLLVRAATYALSFGALTRAEELLELAGDAARSAG
jgi:hypothetical protein